MNLTKKELKDLKKWRAKSELQILLQKVVNGFESKEEPDVELSSSDVVDVLAEMIKSNLD